MITANTKWPSLAKEVEKPHVTLYYNGNRVDDDAKAIIKKYIDFLKKKVSVMPFAYGNNGKNEGLAVEFCRECKIPYHGAKVPHITLSIAEGEKAVNTAFLNFSRHNFTNFIITGKIGFFMEDGTIAYSIEETFERGNVVYVGIFFDKEELYPMSTPEGMWAHSMEQLDRLNPNAD